MSKFFLIGPPGGDPDGSVVAIREWVARCDRA
jgi:hypothetical protein